ncbi:MAG: DnaJ domain-containing protein [Armatimonadota bacterium]
MHEESLYDVLDVSRHATGEEIRRAWFRKVRAIHPEADPERFQRLNQARDVLGDPRRRGAYDQERAHGARIRSLADQAALWIESDPQKALALLKNAVAIAPDLPRPRVLLVHTLLRLREHALAEKQIRWLLENDPRDEVLQYRLARCLWKQRKGDDALVAIEAALALNPAYHDAIVLEAAVRRGDHDFDGVRAALEAAIANDGVEDFADFAALLQLLLLSVEEDDLDIPAAADRVRRVVPTEQVDEAAAKVVEALEEWMRDGRYDRARTAVESLDGPPFAPEHLAPLRERIELGDEAVRLVRDPLVDGGLARCFEAVYLETGNAAVREGRMDEALRQVAAEVDSDAYGLMRRIDRVRSAYPAVARAQGALLAHLMDKAGAATLAGIGGGPAGGMRMTTAPIVRATAESEGSGADPPRDEAPAGRGNWLGGWLRRSR